jgi:signal peptidase I
VTASIASFARFFSYCAVLLACAWTVLHALVFVPFHIPTGSMAPAFRGHHRVCTCTRCGQTVVIGRHFADTLATGEERFYRKTFCANCGLMPLNISHVTEVPGDYVIANKAAYLVRSPSRWEIVVFRLLGSFYIKRLLGLPGESILIHDGDLYVNNELCRKRYSQAKRMRVQLFEHDHAPGLEGWQPRWECSPHHTPGARPIGLAIDGIATPMTLTYRNVSLDTGKCEAIRDEYAYNAGVHANSENVHDFMIETDVEICAGAGSLTLRLCDGHDTVEVRIPVGAAFPIETFADPMRKLAETKSALALRVGERYHIEMALVDRRMSLTIDGKLLQQVDLPAAKERAGVTQPFQIRADGVCAALHGFRLFRDVHYGQQGKQAVQGKMVRLGVDQYFFLGDNSPHSEDSRFWPDEGRVPAADLIGPVLRSDH